MSSTDVIFIGVALLVVAVSVVLGAYILSEFQAMPEFSSGKPAEFLGDSYNALLAFDYLFIFLGFGFFMAAVISAWFIKTHPLFFVGTFIITILAVFLSGQFSNLYYSVVTANAGLTAVANQFPTFLVFFENLPFITLVFSGVVAVVQYGKPVSSNPYGYA